MRLGQGINRTVDTVQPPFAILGSATRSDVAGVAALLATALAEDAELRCFVDGYSRDRRLRSHLAAEACAILDAGGALDTGRNQDNQLLAAAVWEQPGFRETAWQSLRHAPARLEAVRLQGLVNWLRHGAQFARFRPASPHWHLVRLGTDAAFRGRGLATALLEERLARIDSMGLPAHVEASSADSARLYARLGFSISGEIGLPGNVRVLAMTRPARFR
jgi:GNAT superfamily N-acetyltransferase